MGLYRLKPKCGLHRQRGANGEWVIYKPGDTVESDVDLTKVFKNKFEEVVSADRPTAVLNIPLPHKDDEGGGAEEASPPRPGDYGKEVTKDFPLADELGLRVYEKYGWFTVVDPGDGTVLNEKRLRKDAVEKFLREYLPEETDDATLDTEASVEK